MVTLYVGNLPADAKPETLERLFGRYGQVDSVNLYADEAARRRSYGLVEMSERDAARRASRLLDGQNFRGRFITVETVPVRRSQANTAH